MTRPSLPRVYTTRTHWEEQTVRTTDEFTVTTKAGSHQRTARVEHAVARFVFFLCYMNVPFSFLVFLTIFFLDCILQTSFMIFYDFCSTDNGLYDFEVFDYRHRSM